MNIDKVTLLDLSFLGKEDSVFSLIRNFCVTREGIGELRKHVLNPPKDFSGLKKYAEATRFWMEHTDAWTKYISNGTIVMVQKFYETNDLAIEKPGAFQLFFADMVQRLFHKDTNSFAIFSIHHLTEFLKGCFELTKILSLNPPELIRDLVQQLQQGCEHPLISQIIQTNKQTRNKEWLPLAYRARREIRGTVFKMLGVYARLDALRAMAVCSKTKGWILPELLPSEAVVFEVKQLVHPLLKKPVGYDFMMDAQKRFLFLTGANMSGKSTFLYAFGISALLAHLGMGVPAQEMKISFLEGMITNMHIEDNVVLGESYFFAEVQRMKQTAEKIRNKKYFLLLMDELFKGTNGYDAFECTLAVVKGLLLQKESMMALSTHLDELSEKLASRPEVLFNYCQTVIDDNGGYRFTYRLMEGVSRDRIGFLVLKKEGVLDLLNTND